MKYSTRTSASALLVACVTVAALLAAAPPKTQTVQFKSGDETINGFLALPDSPGRHPALVVIHEYWGMNDWAKQQTEKLAAAGFVALAVDLYRGIIATTPQQASELSRALPRDRAVRDLEAGFDFLAARPDVNKAKIGSIGWCMGGGYSFQLAVHEPRLAACIVYYGPPPTDPTSIEKIKAPFSGISAGMTALSCPRRSRRSKPQRPARGNPWTSKCMTARLMRSPTKTIKTAIVPRPLPMRGAAAWPFWARH